MRNYSPNMSTGDLLVRQSNDVFIPRIISGFRLLAGLRYRWCHAERRDYEVGGHSAGLFVLLSPLAPTLGAAQFYLVWPCARPDPFKCLLSVERLWFCHGGQQLVLGRPSH